MKPKITITFAHYLRICIAYLKLILHTREISIGSHGFEFNLELICTRVFLTKLKLQAARTISAFWKTHKCKLVQIELEKRYDYLLII